MAASVVNEQRLRECAQHATGFAEQLLAEDLGVPVRAELVQQSTAWTESRLVVQHHLSLSSHVSEMTVVLDEDDHFLLVGWQIDKRKASSGSKQLSDDALAQLAVGALACVTLADVIGIETEAVDADHSLSAVTLSGPGPQRQTKVRVNHTTGELIGCLPMPVGKPRPFVPSESSDPELAEHALEVGLSRVWDLLTSALAERLDPGQVDQAASVFSFTPVSAERDMAGRLTLVYRLWRRFTTSDVAVDSREDAVVSWYLESRQSEAQQPKLSLPAAIEAATPHLLASVGVHGPTAVFDNVGGEHQVVVHWWHAEADCNIEGDQTTVLVNADSGQVFSVSRKWRDIAPALLAPPRITGEQAVAAADKAQGASCGRLAGRSVIELGGDASEPEGVHDVAVWSVIYTGMWGLALTEWSIDCHTGQPVRSTGW